MLAVFDNVPGAPRLAADTPPLRAYGLAPGASGYRLADLRCTPHPDRRSEGVYSEFAVGLVLDGAFEYSGEAGSGTAVPGAFVFGNPHEEFAFRPLCAEGNRRLVLFITSGLLEAVADDLALDSARLPLATAPPSKATLGVSAKLLRIARGADDAGEAAAAVVETAFRRAGARNAERVSPVDERRIVDAARYINANFTSPCSLDELASVAGMSRFRFARRFRAVTGETANQYVLNRRLSAAALRLAATQTPVLEVAYGVGFNDLSYFYARFKAAFGCAPGAWRSAQRV